MQRGEGPTVDEAVSGIATLLAKAYQRYAKFRLVRATEEALPSTEALDNTGEPSPHELTLTGQRGRGKESAQS